MGAKTYHFISGLPRSGSTLLTCLLRQNPRFQAGVTSPVAALFRAVIDQFSSGNEISGMVDPNQRANILRALFGSYYDDCPREIVFDLNRAWTANLTDLLTLFPGSKVICLVRNVGWIMDSLERQFRSASFENTRLFQAPAEGSTVYTRLEALANSDRLVGFPYHALREACYSDHADRLVLVDYDLLAARPADVMGLLYEFLGEEPFDHFFEGLDYDEPEYDSQLGMSGLHRVHPEVAPRPRRTILPPDLFQRYAQMDFWREMADSKAFRLVLDQTSPAT